MTLRSVDGEQLRRHVTVSDVHTFFVIDRSGSMGSTTICPDSNDIRDHGRFVPGGDLDTVLGVVYEAAHKYILERTVRAPRDIATFVPFNDSARIDFSGWAVSDPSSLLDRMMQTEPSRGTKFDQALQTMQTAVQQVRTALFAARQWQQFCWDVGMVYRDSHMSFCGCVAQPRQALDSAFVARIRSSSPLRHNNLSWGYLQCNQLQYALWSVL